MTLIEFIPEQIPNVPSENARAEGALLYVYVA